MAEAAGVFGHFLSTIWDIFSPHSQHAPELSALTEAALVTPATASSKGNLVSVDLKDKHTPLAAGATARSVAESADSLVYSASTKHAPAWKSLREERDGEAAALGGKRRMEEDEGMPWGF
jgi:hypothetical protein